MKTRSTEIRIKGKAGFNLTPVLIVTLLLMVGFGGLAGWIMGRVVTNDQMADGLELDMGEFGEEQDFIVDCEEGFYHVVLNTPSNLQEGVISLSLNGNSVASTYITNTESNVALQAIVLRNVEFPACTNGTLRAFFDDSGIHVTSIEMKTGYESWVEDFPGLPDDPMIDSDSDGVNNLNEYMVGGDPLDSEDTGYQPELRDNEQLVYALTDDPRIQYETMASVSSNSVDFNAENTVYVGSKPFGDTMRLHFSVLSEPCELVTLDLDYVWDSPQTN